MRCRVQATGRHLSAATCTQPSAHGWSVVELVLGDSVAAWTRAGFAVGDGTVACGVQVLLTGEAGNEADRQTIEKLVREQPTVRNVFNEVVVAPFTSTLSQRAKDPLITTQVKASLLDAKLSGTYFPEALSAEEIRLSLTTGTRLRYDNKR